MLIDHILWILIFSLFHLLSMYMYSFFFFWFLNNAGKGQRETKMEKDYKISTKITNIACLK